MLVRRFVNASFRLLARADWDKGACQEYNGILSGTGGPLWCALLFITVLDHLTAYSSPSDLKVPISLAYHLADIYIEELNKVLGNPTSPPLPAPLQTLLQPFLSLAAQAPTSVTYKRIQFALFDPLFSALSSPTLEEKTPVSKRARLSTPSDTDLYPHVLSNACYEDPTVEGKVDGPTLKKKLLKLVFNVASQPETRDSNRRKMYALWKEGADEGDSDGHESD